MSDPIFSPSELAGCARRELRMRERVYPRWIERDKMRQEDADRELALMRAIVALLEERERQHAPELF